MLNTVTDLGHAFTIWCSFNEVIPFLKDEDRRLFATERFAEFVAQQTYQESSDYTRQDLPQVDKADVLSAGLKRPGFLGHNLITLGTLLRYQPELEGREYNAGLYPNTTRIRLMSTPESGQDLRGYAASKRRAAPSFGETVLVVV